MRSQPGPSPAADEHEFVLPVLEEMLAHIDFHHHLLDRDLQLR
jgi:hypothetical protein